MNERIQQILIKQAKPFLSRGEEIRYIFQAARGENPWVAAWSTIVRFPRLIVVTDSAILVLSTTWFGKPNAVVARLDRSTRLGPPAPNPWTIVFPPLWGRQLIRVNNERLWAKASRDNILAINSPGAGIAES